MVQVTLTCRMVWKRGASTFFSLFPAASAQNEDDFCPSSRLYILRGSRSCRSSCGQLRNRHAGRKQQTENVETSRFHTMRQNLVFCTQIFFKGSHDKPDLLSATWYQMCPAISFFIFSAMRKSSDEKK